MSRKKWKYTDAAIEDVSGEEETEALLESVAISLKRIADALEWLTMRLKEKFEDE